MISVHHQHKIEIIVEIMVGMPLNMAYGLQFKEFAIKITCFIYLQVTSNAVHEGSSDKALKNEADTTINLSDITMSQEGRSSRKQSKSPGETLVF